MKTYEEMWADLITWVDQMISDNNYDIVIFQKVNAKMAKLEEDRANVKCQCRHTFDNHNDDGRWYGCGEEGCNCIGFKERASG